MSAAPRITLAPLRDEDSDALFRWINDHELVSSSAAFRPVPREAHDRWFEQVRHGEDVRIFGIRLLADDSLIGSCQLHSIDPTHHNAELQIRIGEREHWGKGYGTEAVSALLAYGFGKLDLHRIWLHVFVTNTAALRAYEKAGFVREGVQREAALIDGRYVDVVLMGVLRDEPPVGE